MLLRSYYTVDTSRITNGAGHATGHGDTCGLHRSTAHHAYEYKDRAHGYAGGVASPRRAGPEDSCKMTCQPNDNFRYVNRFWGDGDETNYGEDTRRHVLNSLEVG